METTARQFVADEHGSRMFLRAKDYLECVWLRTIIFIIRVRREEVSCVGMRFSI